MEQKNDGGARSDCVMGIKKTWERKFFYGATPTHFKEAHGDERFLSLVLGDHFRYSTVERKNID